VVKFTLRDKREIHIDTDRIDGVLSEGRYGTDYPVILVGGEGFPVTMSVDDILKLMSEDDVGVADAEG
jgi:hypothetical protein